MRTFGPTLKMLREQAGLTILELGIRAGIHANIVRKFERGERDWPRTDTALKLAKALGVSLDLWGK